MRGGLKDEKTASDPYPIFKKKQKKFRDMPKMLIRLVVIRVSGIKIRKFYPNIGVVG